MKPRDRTAWLFTRGSGRTSSSLRLLWSCWRRGRTSRRLVKDATCFGFPWPCKQGLAWPQFLPFPKARLIMCKCRLACAGRNARRKIEGPGITGCKVHLRLHLDLGIPGYCLAHAYTCMQCHVHPSHFVACRGRSCNPKVLKAVSRACHGLPLSRQIGDVHTVALLTGGPQARLTAAEGSQGRDMRMTPMVPMVCPLSISGQHGTNVCSFGIVFRMVLVGRPSVLITNQC